MPSRTATNEPLRLLVIGGGQRGIAYAHPISQLNDARVHAIAEPVAYRRSHFGKKYIWGTSGSPSEGQQFSDWKSWLAWELERRRLEASGHAVPPGIDAVCVCTLDEMHVEILLAIAPLNLHILSEKPLATSNDDCRRIAEAFAEQTKDKIFSIGHVLRYSPHNILLRKLLLEDCVIGDLLSLEHTEPVGWQHFAHSYTRGNWRRQTENHDGSLLTKSCHDCDIILWFMAQPLHRTAGDRGTHMPRSIASTGSRNQFRKSRKPAAAGNATNCTSCPVERSCQYSALRIYDDDRLKVGKMHWLSHVVHDLEDVYRDSGVDVARTKLYAKLAEDYDVGVTPDEQIRARPWYGRCVYESDNDVCDDQVVTIKWDEEDCNGELLGGKTATLHMIANTERECERRGIVYGTKGELTYDSHTIRYFDFVTQKSTVVEAPNMAAFEGSLKSHGGGDKGLATAFVEAVQAVERQGMSAAKAQAKFVGCTLEDAVLAHAVVFAAEEARRDEKVVMWKDWWAVNGVNVH